MISNSRHIFSPDVPSMKGKSVQKRPEAVISNYVKTPKEILEMYADLEVYRDIMFINKLPFLVIVSKILQFTTIEYTPNRTEKELAKSVNKILHV